MAHLIVKNRKLCIAPGSRRLVTSNGGAPCVCDGEIGQCTEFGDPPAQPCGYVFSISGVTIDQECDGTELTAFSGINGLHYRVYGESPRSRVAVGWKRPSRDWWGLFTEFEYGLDLAYCVSNGAWYVSGESSPVAPGRLPLDGYTTNAPVGTSTRIGGNITLDFTNLATYPIGTPIPNQFVPGDCDNIASLTLGGGVVTLVAVLYDCEDQDKRYRAVSCDGSQSIWVDLPDTSAGGYNAELNGELYRLTDEPGDDPAVAVDWVAQDCPVIDPNDDSNLWERCGSGGTSGFPVPFRARGPQHSGFGFGYSYQTYPDPSDSHPNCQIIFGLRYKKIPDDGGTYPSIPISPYAGPCASLPGDIASRTGCQNNGTGPVGQPVDPAGAGGGGVDPMQQVFDQQVQNFGCSGCGDPGV